MDSTQIVTLVLFVIVILFVTVLGFSWGIEEIKEKNQGNAMVDFLFSIAILGFGGYLVYLFITGGLV